MAKNYEEFRKHGKQMVDYICDYVKTMDERPVAPTIDPGYLVPLLAGKSHATISFEWKKILKMFLNSSSRNATKVGKLQRGDGRL